MLIEVNKKDTSENKFRDEDMGKKIMQSASLIVVLTLFSKLLGFFRESLIAAKFGSGIEADAFFIALSASALITDFLKESVRTTYIPIASEVEAKTGKESKIHFTNNMLNILLIISFFASVLSIIFAPALVKLIGVGFQGEQFKLAVTLARIGMPTIIFAGVIGTLTGYLNSEEKYRATGMLGVPYNLVYIVFLLFLANTFGIMGLMVAGVIGTFTQVLIQIPEAKSTGYKYAFVVDFRDKYLSKVLRLSVPILIGVAISNVGVIVDKSLATTLTTGSVSALNYSNKLNALISSVFIMAITTVVFPKLSKAAAQNDYSEVKRIMHYGMKLVMVVTIPAMVGLMVLAVPIVSIAFERGAFTVDDTIMTSQALVGYSLGLIAIALRLVIVKVYYSLKDTTMPMVLGFISTGFDIALNFAFIGIWKHVGLALSTSVGEIILVIMLFYVLRKKIGPLGLKNLATTFLKISLAALVMGVVTYVSYQQIFSLLGDTKIYNLISLGISVSVSILLYAVIAYFLKVDIIKDVIDEYVLKRNKKTT